MQKTLELAYNPVEVLPPTHLRTLTLKENTQPIALSTPSSATHSFRWNRAIGVAAAVAIVTLGINNYRLWSTLKVARQAPQSVSQPALKMLTYVLLDTKSAAGAATLAVNPNTLKASFTAQNLPPLSSGKTYVLWTMLKPEAPFTKDKKAAILTKVFKVDDQGKTFQTIAVPEVYRSKDLVVTVEVTVEDAAAPQNHAGTPVLITKKTFKMTLFPIRNRAEIRMG